MYGVGIVPAAAQEQTGAQNWNLFMGAQGPNEEGGKPAWQLLKFYADDVTIHVGDSITWKHNSSFEPHTVTFLGPETTIPEFVIPEGEPPPAGPPTLVGNPIVFFQQGGATYDGSAYANSGFISDEIPGPKEYKLTFPTAGTYNYICALHAFQLPDGTIQGMKGKVTVVEAGAALPKTPAQVEADIAASIKADQDKAVAKEPELATFNKPSVANPDGTMTHYVNVGYFDIMNSFEYQRFWPKTLNVNQGDTVVWSMPVGGFHTVTFGEEPELFTLQPQPTGPPKVLLNPMFFPAGGTTHTGTGYYNSGPLAGPEDPPEVGPKTYSLTFTQAGRYEYICMPHYHLGMDASVVVAARTGGTTQPGMPRTGEETAWLLYALGTGLALAGAGVVLRFRRARKAA